MQYIYINKCTYVTKTCARRAHRHPSMFKTPQMLAVGIQYKYILQNVCTLYIHQLKGSTKTLRPAHIYILIFGWIYANNVCFFLHIYNTYISIWFEEYMSVEFIFRYWIPVTKCTFSNIYIYLYWIYVANILGDRCQLEFFCAPFGRRVRDSTFCNIHICIGYMRPTFGGYMSVGGFLCTLWAQD